jgi:tripartite-type tricarboxylate transporter receptor subunit TctC
VQYKTEDMTPVFWYHYTPDALVVPEQSPIKSFADFMKAAKASPGKLNLGGSGLNSANHAAHERLNAAVRRQDHLRALQGHRRHGHGGAGRADRRRDELHRVRHQQQGQGARAGGGDGQRHPLLPDVPTFKELGVDWVDGAYRGIGVPKSTPPEVRKRCRTCGPC